ncbi:MAG: 23S rRNA (adenine(2503)-C(2))-methyltransferase RlmN [Candidatus Kapabacteria bacterium]|jgi:23S rRNA (adenine2503-C2)-methyltransferase|nr:23S rRNA (adenine(2503)-C(2))-methyltransferase RlmN [Candidatus Kapabacteria bacterium]
MGIPRRDIVEGPTELKGLPLAELAELFAAIGEKRYRAQQVYDALYVHRVDDLQSVEVLPKALRATLAEGFRSQSVQLKTVQDSADGTMKFLFSLYDGRAVESVLIPSELREADGLPRRRTLCVSTQVGCNLGCAFCATATLNLTRNLTAGEIVDQFLVASLYSDRPITNVVYMGMGEPMNNYDNVMKASSIFNDQRTGMVAPRRTTLSTAGVVPGILRMADENSLLKLAISLHATTQEQRLRIMPIAKRWPLEELMEAIEVYYRKTRKTITYEYILFEGFNDSHDDVRRLAKIARRVPSKVNVIPFHEIDFTHPSGISADLRPTSPQQFELFLQALRAEGVRVLVRSSSGLDIDAACGQLAFSDVHGRS